MRLILYQLAHNSWERKKICIVKLYWTHTFVQQFSTCWESDIPRYFRVLSSSYKALKTPIFMYCSIIVVWVESWGKSIIILKYIFRWKTTCLKCKTVWKPSKYHEYCSALCSVCTYTVASLQLYLNFHVNISFHLNKSNEWTASKSFMLLIRMDKHTLLFQWIQWASIKEVVTLYLFNI